MYIVRLYFFVGKHINIEIKSQRINHEMLKSGSPGRITGNFFSLSLVIIFGLYRLYLCNAKEIN